MSSSYVSVCNGSETETETYITSIVACRHNNNRQHILINSVVQNNASCTRTYVAAHRMYLTSPLCPGSLLLWLLCSVAAVRMTNKRLITPTECNIFIKMYSIISAVKRYHVSSSPLRDGAPLLSVKRYHGKYNDKNIWLLTWSDSNTWEAVMREKNVKVVKGMRVKIHKYYELM